MNDQLGDWLSDRSNAEDADCGEDDNDERDAEDGSVAKRSGENSTEQGAATPGASVRW